MVLYGSLCFVWSHRVLYGPPWSRIVPYGPSWFCMVPCGPICSRMVMYCPIWPCMVPYDPLWSCMVFEILSPVKHPIKEGYWWDKGNISYKNGWYMIETVLMSQLDMNQVPNGLQKIWNYLYFQFSPIKVWNRGSSNFCVFFQIQRKGAEAQFQYTSSAGLS